MALYCAVFYEVLSRKSIIRLGYQLLLAQRGVSGSWCWARGFSNSCGCSWWQLLVLLPGSVNLGLQLHAQVRLDMVFPGAEQVPVQTSCLVYAPEGMSCGSQLDGAVQRIAPKTHCLHIGLPHSACLVAAILTDLVATQYLPACIEASPRAVESPGHLLHSKGHAASVTNVGHLPARGTSMCTHVSSVRAVRADPGP